LTEESAKSPQDIERQLGHVAGQTWRSAKMNLKILMKCVTQIDCDGCD